MVVSTKYNYCTIAFMYEAGVVKGKQVVLDCMIDNFDTIPLILSLCSIFYCLVLFLFC